MRKMINPGKRCTLFVGSAADDHDHTTVNYDVQRTSTIGGGGDEGQGAMRLERAAGQVGEAEATRAAQQKESSSERARAAGQ